MPGIFQSRNAMSKGRPVASASFAQAMAASPELAVTTSKLMLPSSPARICRACSLSSTTSMRRPRRSGSGNSARCLVRPSPRPSRAVNQKVLPWPGVLSTPTSPPISPASFLEMASPSPVPPYLRVVEVSACSNDRKRRDCCSWVNPIPVSWTSKRMRTPVASRAASSTRMTISPSSVNLTALLP
ncbi:hypothetical protein D3C71_1471850 [compost metagenome]